MRFQCNNRNVAATPQSADGRSDGTENQACNEDPRQLQIRIGSSIVRPIWVMREEMMSGNNDGESPTRLHDERLGTDDCLEASSTAPPAGLIHTTVVDLRPAVGIICARDPNRA